MQGREWRHIARGFSPDSWDSSPRSDVSFVFLVLVVSCIILLAPSHLIEKYNCGDDLRVDDALLPRL
jgi:hypothetical protein